VNPRPALYFAQRILGLRTRGLPGGGARPEDAPGRRYLRGAILGVALSIVPLVVVLIVADGMIQGITARYIEVGTYHLQAQPLVVVDQQALENAATSLRALPGVSAFPEFQGYGVAISGSRTAVVAVRAVDPSFLKDPGTAAYLTINAGEMRLDSTNQILLGESLAKDLGAAVGDTVSIVTSRPTYGGSTASFVPKVSVFRVRGIVSAGYRELDALWAFVSLRAGSKIFWAGGSHALVGIKVEKPFGDLERQRALAQASLSPEWTIVTWPEAERNIFRSFSTTRALLLLVMALAVAVAAINVGSALVMLVLERRRDIAILKSAGASPGLIGGIFVFTGLAIGGAGTLIGIGAGSLLAWRINDFISVIERLVNGTARLWAGVSGAALPRAGIRLLDPAYYLERIPVNIRFGELIAVAGASLILCLLASLIPASRASRLPPLEIFRKT
jgi:lipoprotein-releasing system permease protein